MATSRISVNGSLILKYCLDKPPTSNLTLLKFIVAKCTSAIINKRASGERVRRVSANNYAPDCAKKGTATRLAEVVNTNEKVFILSNVKNSKRYACEIDPTRELKLA